MKRLLLSVFAAAITAAFVVPAPASAADINLSGQYRVRGEYVNNNDYNDNLADAQTNAGQRVRLTANAQATDDTSVKVTIQDTRTWGSAGAAGLLSETQNTFLDLHEAYVNINNVAGTPISLRAGRMEVAYGDQRQLGSFGWSNNGRAFEGLKLNFTNEMANLDVFRLTVSNDATAADDDTSLTGAYLTLGSIVPNNTIDAYLLNRNDNNAVTLNTYGLRVKGSHDLGLDYTAEVALQSGDASATTSYDGLAYAITAGYTLPTAMKVRIGAEYDFASGEDTGTTDVEAYQQLYPTNHGHFGIGDVVNTWSNISAWSINAKANVNEQLTVKAAYWSYSQDEVTVAANGDNLGSEIDIVANYKYNSAVQFQAGYAHFTPDTATSGAGNPDDARGWGYIQLTANF